MWTPGYFLYRLGNCIIPPLGALDLVAINLAMETHHKGGGIWEQRQIVCVMKQETWMKIGLMCKTSRGQQWCAGYRTSYAYLDVRWSVNSSQIFFSWQHVQRHCHVETEWVISQTAGSHTGNKNMTVDGSIKFPFIMTFLVFFFSWHHGSKLCRSDRWMMKFLLYWNCNFQLLCLVVYM